MYMKYSITILLELGLINHRPIDHVDDQISSFYEHEHRCPFDTEQNTKNQQH